MKAFGKVSQIDKASKILKCHLRSVLKVFTLFQLCTSDVQYFFSLYPS